MVLKKTKCASGMTLVEVMIAAIILVIIVLGTVSFRYASYSSVRIAERKLDAVRTVVLLSETWKAQTDDPNMFDAIAAFDSDLTIDSAGPGPAKPADYILLDNYTVNLNGKNYFTTLSWKLASAGLYELNVAVAWQKRDWVDDTFDDADSAYSITTYKYNN